MSKRTPNLDLILQLLEDYGDKRIDNTNYEIIDRWAKTHSHNGIDSAFIDLDSIWIAIEELRNLCAQLRVDLTNNEIKDNLRYAEYQHHKHYDIDSPPSVETHWFDTFNDLFQTDTANTTMSVSTAIGSIHLPKGYTNNAKYSFVSKPFRLEHTLEAGYNTDIRPDQAKAKIFMTRQGAVTPYIAIGPEASIVANPSRAHRYPNAIAGVNTGITALNNYVTSKFNFDGKVSGNLKIPHLAYHHHEVQRPPVIIKQYDPGQNLISTQKRSIISIGGKDGIYIGTSKSVQISGGHGHQHTKIKRFPRITTDREFSTAEYQRVALSDGEDVLTTSLYNGSDPVIKEKPVPIKPRILYHGDEALAWHRATNKFYFYLADDNNFEIIDDADIAPLVENNMINVAAGKNRKTGDIWVLKTWAVRLEKPNGYFEIRHQIVKWDGGKRFKSGKIWTTGKCRTKHWLPRVICPTHLHVHNGNVHIFTHMRHDDHEEDHDNVVNYYEDNPYWDFDAYMWFPWSKIYGNLHKQRKYVHFAHFNPGILATHHSVKDDGDLVPVGPAKIIGGAYNSTANRWSALSDEDINKFEGGNDNVFLGVEGTEAFFYQGFVHYNGADVLTKELWKDAAYRNANPDTAWHGIVAHNMATGTNRFIRGNMPFKVNVAGAIDPEGTDVDFMGGTELVKQFVTDDNRIIATADDQPPPNTPIKYAFWSDRFMDQTAAPDSISTNTINADGSTLYVGQTVVANRLDYNVFVASSTRVKISTGNHIRINASVSSSVSVNSSITVRHKSHMHMTNKSFILVGGVHIHNRRIRCRRHHRHHNNHLIRIGALINNAKARQVFVFELGDRFSDDDTVKIHVKSNSEGKRPADTPTSNPFKDDVLLLHCIGENTSGRDQYETIGRIKNGDGTQRFTINNLNDGNMMLMLESTRVSDRTSKQLSKLSTDHIYVTVERQGYVYTYDWDKKSNNALTFNGDTTGIVLESSSGNAATDPLGVQITSAEFSIISNIEGKR